MNIDNNKVETLTPNTKELRLYQFGLIHKTKFL